MRNLMDEFRRGWHGVSDVSPLASLGFAASCLALATAARWGLAQIRPDVFFTPYLPAVFFATALGGLRTGVLTAVAASALGIIVNFGNTTADLPRIVLMFIFWLVGGLTIWGVAQYRSIVTRERQIAKRLIE